MATDRADRPRYCLWCGEQYVAGHACDRPADFTTWRLLSQPGGRRVRARTYVLTPAGWKAAGYRLVYGRYVKEQG